MFTIDLLKGKGVPIRSNPGTAALKVIPFLLPLILGLYWVGTFQYNNTVMASERAGMEKMQEKIKEYSTDIQQVRQWISATEQTRKNLAEVSRGLGRHLQWSETLRAVAECMPESIALKEISLSRSSAKKRMADPKNPSKQISRTIIKRILTIRVYGKPSWETDEAVQQYLQQLHQSPAFMRIMQDIKAVSRQSDQIKDQAVTVHVIECTVKPQE